MPNKKFQIGSLFSAYGVAVKIGCLNITQQSALEHLQIKPVKKF